MEHEKVFLRNYRKNPRTHRGRREYMHDIGVPTRTKNVYIGERGKEIELSHHQSGLETCHHNRS